MRIHVLQDAKPLKRHYQVVRGVATNELSLSTHSVDLLVRTPHHKQVLLVFIRVKPNTIRHFLVGEP